MKVTRSHVIDYIKENFETIKVETIENVVDHIASLSIEEVLEKFKKGAKENGKFDLESIACLFELRDECKDALSYSAMNILQEMH